MLDQLDTLGDLVAYVDQDIASDVVAVGEARGHTLARGEMHHRRDAGEIVDPEIEHVDAVDGTVGRPQRLGRGEVVDAGRTGVLTAISLSQSGADGRAAWPEYSK